MGVASSSNVTKFTTNIISESLHEIVRKELSNITQSQVLTITNVAGNVDITGNLFSVNVNVDVRGIGEAMSNSENRQNVEQDLTQRAKALVKDINLGSVADADNIIENYITDTLKVTTSLSDICQTEVSTSQTITIDKVDGNVTFSNNEVVSSVKSLTDCAQKAVARSTGVNALQTALSQSAESEAKGFSIWGLATIGGLIVLGIVASVLLPVIAPAFVAGKYPMILGMIVLAVGLLLLAVWWFTGKAAVRTTLWSRLYANSCPNLRPDLEVEIETADAAAAKCIEGKYAAFDWVAWTLDPSTETYYQTSPVARFYKQLPANCKPSQDDLPVMTKRKIYAMNRAPQGTDRVPKGSVWFSYQNAAYYIMGDVWGAPVSLKAKILQGLNDGERNLLSNYSGWLSPTGPIMSVSGPGDNEPVSLSVPIKLTVDGDLYDITVTSNVGSYLGQTSTVSPNFTIPGPGKQVGGPDLPHNTSGYVYTARSNKWLYPGIGVMALGCVLLVLLSGKKPQKTLNPAK